MYVFTLLPCKQILQYHFLDSIYMHKNTIFIFLFLTYFTLYNQIRSDQSLSRVWLSATPWIAARQASLSIPNSRYIPTYNDLLCQKLRKATLLVFNHCRSERQKRRSISCFNTYVLKLTIFIDTYWSLACFLWRIKLFLFFVHFLWHLFSFNRCSFYVLF